MDPLQRVLSGKDTRLQDQRQQRVTDSRFQQMERNSPHYALQDSNLSPALSLLPSESGMEHNTDYSLFQQSDMEFAPLRAYPDMSVASEKFQIPPHEFTSQTLDQASLSQHPLAPEITLLSEEAQSPRSSLSQHSLSPDRVKTREENGHLAPITEEEQDIVSKVTFSSNLEKVEDTYFLNKDVSAQQLLQTLQKDVGVPSSSSSSTHSSKKSETKEFRSVDKPDPNLIREGPPGEASVSQHQQQKSRDSYINESKTRLSDVFNVSVGPRCTKPDDSSDALRQELLDIQRRNSRESSQKQNKGKTPKEYATPFPTRIPRTKHLANENVSSALSTGPFSSGIPQRLRELKEHDLWSPGNQTGIDGSYLGFLPQSQSTPGIFKAPLISNVKSKFQQLSDIESTKESSIQIRADTSPPSNSAPDIESKSEEETTCDKVQSLPSLNYMQKVDAWRANQSSGKGSLFDSLALQGFTGVSPKKKAYDAVSDSLNRILSQQVVKTSQNVAQNPSAEVSATSSPRREEAVGSAPNDNIATTQSASPFNRSQSHSSLSTVVMSVKKEQAAESRTEKNDTEEVEMHPNTEGELSPVVISLGQFSDVTLSNSQDSSNSEQKVATSIGTSSVSLEVDNYDPYWTAKLTTPPPQHKPRELNIEERIPLYLKNLGISQSPSTILTPFAPRGPIREPEFSPTELGTIKGSTPTKSIQPSEGGTPHKVEFSRSSLQSMDSSVSVPMSSEVIRQDLFTPASSSSSEASAAGQSDPKLHSHPTADHSSQPQRDDIQNPVYSGPSLGQEANKNLLQQGSSAEQNEENSFVSSGTFSDIRKLFSQAEVIVSPRLSTASDRFLSQRKEASFTSAFATESQSSHQWTRSSSDSVMTAKRLTGGDNVQPARQSGVVSRSAGLSLVLNKSVQRAEPEGCSAAPPDGVLPQPQVQPPPPSAAIATTVPEESKEISQETSQETSQHSPAQSSTSSPVPVESMSGRSSESSLAIRVAKLLQTESPATMVSSTASVDQEEGRAREWIKQMISGQKCEPLELDQEDRRRIEEIKRELLLKNPKLGYASTDTESSAASSLRGPKGQAPLYQIKADKSKIQETQPDLSRGPTVPQLNTPQREEIIVTKVREIAAREGVNLPKTKALTSITISTSRRSTSPTSPAPPRSPNSEPLHVNQLTTEDDNKKVPATLDEQSQRQERDEMAVESQVVKLAVRQDTVGGHHEFPPVSSMTLEQNKTKGDNSQVIKKIEMIESSKAEQVTSKSGHISQVRLLLSPKPMDQSSSMFTRDVISFPKQHFIPLTHSPSTPSSPDEGVGLSSPPEWQEVPKRGERFETDRRLMQQQRVTSAIHLSPKTFAVDSTTVPHLLPYKPNGSEELFYVPQTEADSSNDTTMESTHTGSDDAHPPRFSSDVLGHQDPGLDRGVTIRHTEGIYSKRLTKPGFNMSELERREAINSPGQTPKPSSPVLTRVLLPDTELPTASRRDQGTSPVSFLTHDPPPAPKTQDPPKLQTGHRYLEPYQDDLSPSTSKRNISDLDQLWQRFSERWRGENESSPVGEREVSLLERLERLSRIIHATRDSSISELDVSNKDVPQKSRNTGDLRELKRQRQAEKIHKSVYYRRNETESRYRPDLDNEKLSSPAEQDISVDSTSSTSMSTVDTARLIRAFGAERVQRNLRSSSSLSKLYSVISKQKEQEREATTPSETSATEESSVSVTQAVVDSVSSTCTYTLPPHRGPSKSLISKRVKLVSKGIQAGDLEIVSNGTRRHTRDVGTTFPSPGDVRGLRRSSSSSSLDREHKTHRGASSKSQKHKKSPHTSASKGYPHGVSWFISADELKAEARKENEPQQWRPSAVWFEPASGKPAWREPLRQRPLEEQRNTPQTETDPGPGRKSLSVSRVNLQDALLSGRPDFVSRSRRRLERLAQQVEERRLQALFHQEREELFIQPGGPGRLPRPAGTAQLRRAVPRKEMIQRSKQIYENLPEVRRRKEEERRKAEYRSYRLNAQLYNKRITSRVLGRRLAWN